MSNESIATLTPSQLWADSAIWVDEMSTAAAEAMISSAITHVIAMAGDLLERSERTGNRVVFECAAESLMSMATVQYGVAMGGLSHSNADWQLDLLNNEPATQWRRDIFWAVAVELRYLNRMAQLYAQ